MKTVEREVPNGKTTSLRESVASTLEMLALLSDNLKGLPGAEQVSASLQEIRRNVLKTHPILIWHNPRLTKETNGTKETKPVEHTIVEFEPKDNTPFYQLEELEEESQTKEQLLEENLDLEAAEDLREYLPEDLALAEKMVTAQDGAGTDYIEEDHIFGGIRTGRDLDLVKMYLKEVDQIPMQIEKHVTWGAGIFVGELALKALNQLSESPLLTLAQKEKIGGVLESKKGNFLLGCLTLRIKSVQQKLKRDEYKDKHKDQEATKRKQLDEEFVKMILENEKLVSEKLDDAKATEDEDAMEIILTQFIDHQINFANQGQRSHDSLVEGNLRLCISIAKQYLGHGIGLLDLINYGNFGLMKAAADFDTRGGYQFSTFATGWIRQSIARALADYESTIRLPVHIYEKLKKWKRSYGQDLDEDGRPLDSVPERLRDAFKLQAVYSLDRVMTEPPDNDRTLLDMIKNLDQDTDPEEVAEATSLKDAVEKVLATMPDRERRVIELRFGITDGMSRTLREVGEELGVTRERIRQIEKKALEKLRHVSRSNKLRSFIKDG